MVKSLTIGLVDDGVATWNPVSDGNLLVTGGAGCGKTWWLTHTLIPGLNEMGQRVYMFDGYVDRGYTKPVQGVIPVNDPHVHLGRAGFLSDYRPCESGS